MAVTLDDLINNIATLSQNINDNVFIQNARESVKIGLEAYAVEEDEKAKIYAGFEQQLAAGVMEQIMTIAKELPTITAQEAVVVEQKNLLVEQIETEKEKLDLIEEQIKTEKYRHRDLRASVMIKNQNGITSKQQGKFEEARRYIAIKANEQNMHLKKTDYKVQQLDAIATDNDYILTSEQIADTKETIDNLPTEAISYTTEITGTIDVIPTTEIS